MLCTFHHQLTITTHHLPTSERQVSYKTEAHSNTSYQVSSLLSCGPAKQYCSSAVGLIQSSNIIPYLVNLCQAEVPSPLLSLTCPIPFSRPSQGSPYTKVTSDYDNIYLLLCFVSLRPT